MENQQIGLKNHYIKKEKSIQKPEPEKSNPTVSLPREQMDQLRKMLSQVTSYQVLPDPLLEVL